MKSFQKHYANAAGEQEDDITAKTPDLNLNDLTATKKDGVIVTGKKPTETLETEDKPKKKRVLIRTKGKREMLETEDGPIMLGSKEKAKMKDIDKLREEGTVRPMTEAELQHEKDVRALNWATNSAKKVTDEYEMMHPEEQGTFGPGNKKWITIANLGPATLSWDYDPESVRAHKMNMTLSSGGKSQKLKVPFGSAYREFLNELKDWGPYRHALNIESQGSDKTSDKTLATLAEAFKSGNFNDVTAMRRGFGIDDKDKSVNPMLDINDTYYTDPEQYIKDWKERVEFLASKGYGPNAIFKDIDLPIDDDPRSAAYAANRLIGEQLLHQYEDTPLGETIRKYLEEGKWFGARNKDTGEMEYIRTIDGKPFVVVKSNKGEGYADETGEAVKRRTHKLAPLTEEEKWEKAALNSQAIQDARQAEVEKWANKLTPEQQRHNDIAAKRNINTLKQIMQNSGYDAAVEELQQQIAANKKLKMFYNSLLQGAKKKYNLPSKEVIRRVLPFGDFVKNFTSWDAEKGDHVWDIPGAYNFLDGIDFIVS